MNDIVTMLNQMWFSFTPAFATKEEYQTFVKDFHDSIKPELDENKRLQIESQKNATEI